MEIGSFIGLDLRDSGEFYHGQINIARLNSARAGIYHSCRLYDCNSLYIPYYLCPSVKRFLQMNGIDVKSYFINERFEPVNIEQKNGEAILLVNYFGILASSKIIMLASHFKNVIVDNSAAFYSNPVEGCYSVYSPRKFFGVPDGCYVIGKNAEEYTSDYEQDFSSETASFLLKRIEFGTSATYGERMENEKRIDKTGIRNMSILTRMLLNSIDYIGIKAKRKQNFYIAYELYRQINEIDPSVYADNECVPMVYPLVIEKTDLNDKLKEKLIYTGRWWNQVLNEVPEYTFEAWFSNYMVPVPIDQRYGSQELTYVHTSIISSIEE